VKPLTTGEDGLPVNRAGPDLGDSGLFAIVKHAARTRRGAEFQEVDANAVLVRPGDMLGTNSRLLCMVRNEPAERIPRQAGDPGGFAAKASQTDLDRRYQSVEELSVELTRFRNHEPVEAYRESATDLIVRLYRRYELPILLLVAYIVMRLVLLIWRGV